MGQIHAPEGANRKKTIVGRGASSKGRTCGKGSNGQNARSGGGPRLGFEGGQMPLYRRTARRGFSNYPFKKEYVVVSLDMINEAFRVLRTNLDLMMHSQEGESKVIMLTSFNPNAGKTFTVLNLAASMALKPGSKYNLVGVKVLKSLVVVQ